MNIRSLLAIFGMSAITGSAQAATLAFTDFNDTVKSAASQTMTGIDWTGDDLVLVTAGTSATTTASANAGYFTTNFGATGFAPDQNIGNEGPWSATFTLTLNSATGTLSGISFDAQGLNNSGVNNSHQQTYLNITVNGNAFDGQKASSSAFESFSFADSEALVNGVNTIVITASRPNTTGYNLGIDDLTFIGSVAAIPEPSAALLGGLGLMLLRRRR